MLRRLAPFALLAALGGLSLAGCATYGAPVVDMTPERAPAYIALAASSDMYEIESSRMALQRSRDPRHTAFANQMIRDHGNTTAQLTAAARSIGLGVPMTLMPMHRAMLDELARSRNFDAVYHRQQVMAHEQALALHDNYARRGDNQAMRNVAALAVPVIRGHLSHLRSF